MSIPEILYSLIPPKVSGASINLVAFNSEEKVLYQFGTGTLLKIADDSFLITAAHVPIRAKELSKSLCIGVGNAFLPLYGDWCFSSENTPYDIAALRLPIEVASKLGNTPHVRLQDIDFSTDLSKGVFCLLGYPNRLSSPSTTENTTLNVTPFQYLTYAYKGETDNLAGYQQKYHLLLSAQDGGTGNEDKLTKFVDRNGASLKVPKELGGISGCSVWKIGEYDKPLSEWKRYRPKIVAVQTGVYSEAQIIKGTRWIAVSTLLYQAFPDLGEVLKLSHVEY